jgi:uncharacterized protein (TIGR03790 family)
VGQDASAPAQAAPRPAAPSAAGGRTLVVVNEASAESREVGAYYVRMRAIPPANVVRVNVSTSDNISYDEYKHGIEAKVRAAIRRARPRIDFIVLTKGVPIRLRDNNGHSVDGHLVAMDRDFEPIPTHRMPYREAVERSVNPFFGSQERFDSTRFRMFLVTRLDGYTLRDAKALVDNSLRAKRSKGPFFFDKADNRAGGGYGQMQETLARAHQVLLRKGFDARLDRERAFRAPAEPLAGYASWGSNDAAFDLSTYRSLRFLPGALAQTFVSTSGRTFRPTTGGQSLIADLIAQGVTGVKGYVSEPYTIALARPDILFDRYTSGWNLAEAMYAASPLIKWKCVVIGDPLCNPHGTNP